MNQEVDKRYYINDDCIKRILLARDNNEDKALEVWKKWIVKLTKIRTGE